LIVKAHDAPPAATTSSFVWLSAWTDNDRRSHCRGVSLEEARAQVGKR
jgi:hypothetical protein